MTPQEFVAALKKNVLAAAADATIAMLEHPPGRRPRQDLVEASNWFRSLSVEDRATLARVLTMTAHHAIFGFLAVLDGARTIEDGPNKGQFELLFHKDNTKWNLTDPREPPLHNILNQQPDDKVY